ncbi:MAG: HAMP domain-containing histidine kinase [Bacteroidetes bacterium]|nr:HAMP domain-containing histidine kinase [Bacteroidota bacterium]
MRLQAKINIRFLSVMFLIFTVVGVLFYFMIGRVVDQNIREMLDSRKAYIILNLQKKSAPIDSIISLDHSLFVRKIEKPEGYEFYADTMAYDQREKELIPFRKLTFTVKSGDRHYEVTLLQSLLEMEDLRMVIFTFMGGLFILLMVSLFFVNRWLSSKAWNPFFKSLSLMSTWKFSEGKAVNFDATGIAEFDQLNRLLENMMQKIRTDFVNLKEFTENASHEIQTPLAIIKSKLELVLQDKSLNDRQHQQIKAAFESTIRLSKLNEALLLLSRIENQQFVGKQEIDFCQLIQSRVDFFEELFGLKQIEVMFQTSEPVLFTLNPLLAEILVNNLLSNALRHNHENGKVIISAKNQEITISNTGKTQPIDATRLFQRFAKQTASGESNGLGLSIASEICKSNRIQLSYRYSDGMHHFVLSSK